MFQRETDPSAHPNQTCPASTVLYEYHVSSSVYLGGSWMTPAGCPGCFRGSCDYLLIFLFDGNAIDICTVCFVLSEVHRWTDTSEVSLEMMCQGRPWHTTSDGGCSAYNCEW